MLFSTYKNTHFVAVFVAGAIHVAAGFWAMMPSSPIVINQQAIQVSFVAPSGENKSDSHKKTIIKNEKLDGLKAQRNEEKQELAAKKETSGRVDPNATSSKSAESEPVFDAAYLNNPAPFYPSAAKRKNIQGKVLVNVAVKIDGTPSSVEISRSSGSSQLDEAAIAAIKQWRFIPAKSNGKAVAANVIVPIEFKII